MHVLMIAPQPFFQPRGTPFSVLHRLNALSRLGYEVDLLTYHIGQNIDMDGVTIHRIWKVPFVKQIAIGPSKSKVLLDIFLIIKTVLMLRHRRYDLIHSHEEAGFWTAYLARKYKVAHLYDMHSSLPQQLHNFQFTKMRWLFRLFEKLENYTIESADAIITICPELFNHVKKIKPNKFNCLIENVADNAAVFKKDVDVRSIKQQIRTNGEVAILYTGTFEPYQGLDLLIDSSVEVVKQCPRARYVLVGGKPEQVRHYRKKVAELKIEEHYAFTGMVEPEAIPVFIDNCDVLVSPRVEGNNTPLKIYSYLRSGKPIVATNHLTHTQVLNADVSVLTECTPEAFGAGVLSVIADTKKSKKLSESARVLAEKKYSYDVYLRKTREVYAFLEKKIKAEGSDACVA